MGLHSKWENGELVYYDGAVKILAIPKNALQDSYVKVPSIMGLNQKLAYRFFEDFLHSDAIAVGTMSGWATTLVEGGGGESTLGLSETEVGGALVVTTDAFEDDGINATLNGEAFKLATGKALYFGCRVKVSEVIQSDFMIGLTVANTAILGGVTDGVYFRKVDAAATLAFVTEKGSSETEDADVGSMVAGAWVTLEFFFDGAGTVTAYVNGVLVATSTTTIPDTENLTVAWQFLTGEAVIKIASIDWIEVLQTR